MVRLSRTFSRRSFCCRRVSTSSSSRETPFESGIFSFAIWFRVVASSSRDFARRWSISFCAPPNDWANAAGTEAIAASTRRDDAAARTRELFTRGSLTGAGPSPPCRS